MNTVTSLKTLTDCDLIVEVKRLAQVERASTAALIASLAEMDVRRLYLGEGCSSLFVYCTQVLHLSEHAAYGRIEAARAVSRFPIVLGRLERGELTLTAVSLLRPHLTEANCGELLDAAGHKSKRDLERLVAEIAPRPDASAMVRKLPVRVASDPARAPQNPPAGVMATAATVRDQVRSVPEEDSSAPPAVASGFAPDAATCTEVSVSAAVPPTRACPLVTPLAPERYKVQFTIGPQTRGKLRRAQDLLRHAVPNGDPGEIFDRALTLLVEQLEKAKIGSGRPGRPQRTLAPGSRRVPAAVRRVVWARDEGRCAFVGGGRRCGETAFLEFHHVTPYARGGKATADQIQLRCRAHNQYEAVKAFGPRPVGVRECSIIYFVDRALGPDRVMFLSPVGHGRTAEAGNYTPRQRTSNAGSQLSEERRDIAGEQLRLLDRGEVTAARHRGPPAHVV